MKENIDMEVQIRDVEDYYAAYDAVYDVLKRCGLKSVEAVGLLDLVKYEITSTAFARRGEEQE